MRQVTGKQPSVFGTVEPGSGVQMAVWDNPVPAEAVQAIRRFVTPKWFEENMAWDQLSGDRSVDFWRNPSELASIPELAPLQAYFEGLRHAMHAHVGDGDPALEVGEKHRIEHAGEVSAGGWHTDEWHDREGKKLAQMIVIMTTDGRDEFDGCFQYKLNGSDICHRLPVGTPAVFSTGDNALFHCATPVSRGFRWRAIMYLQQKNQPA